MVLGTSSEYNDDHDGESSSRIINLGKSRLLLCRESYDLYLLQSVYPNTIL